MDLSPTAAIKLLLPKLPLIGKTITSHTFGFSSTSQKWDLRTELIVNVLRSFITGTPSTISHAQKLSLKDPGVKGPMWISRVKFEVPGDANGEGSGGLRDALLRCAEELKEGGETWWEPQLEALEAEWTGYRADTTSNTPEPDIPEAEKYAAMMKETKSSTVVLYFHGGAYYLMDPCAHRKVVSRLAKDTGGRGLSVRYRLAPQNPFPAALMDALFAYLCLLYPPPGSLHDAVAPENIVFAGDSAGGHLSASLMQLILQFNRSPSSSSSRATTIDFNGEARKIPLPAGMALNSPWLDVTRCLPSIWSNAHYDYLPPPSESGLVEPPPCPIWPADPPRADLFCEGSALCHPLVSPLAAPDWSGAPPVFIVLGEEMLADECKIFARRLVEQRVSVIWHQYEAMPHVFSALFEGTTVAESAFEQWARAITLMAQQPGEIECEGAWYAARTLKRKDVVPGGDEIALSWDEGVRLMKASREKRIKGFGDVMTARPVEVPRL